MRETQAHIHAMTIEVMSKKGSDAAMTEDEILKVLLPAKHTLDTIKKGGFDPSSLFGLIEFFTITAGAAMTAPVNDGKELINRRKDTVRAAIDALIAIRESGRGTAKGSEIKAIDDGYQAATELHYALPEWCFLQSGLDLIKFGLRQAKVLPSKRVRRKRK